MSDFSGFKDSYKDGINIPGLNVTQDNVDTLLSKSHDIKKQLLQLIHGHTSGGGVSKPQSRKNSVIVRHSDEDDEDDEDKSNERKRRDNINDKIQELLTLIPAELFNEKDKAAPVAKNEEEADIAAAMRNSGTKDGKPNKGQILTKSVEYLQQLQAEIDDNNRKEVELIMKVKQLEMKRDGKEGMPVSVGYTSAERALGEIGVGPLSDDYFKGVLMKSGRRRGSVS